jgi:tetratricopeptide (TPR) repeat protein
MTSRPALAIRVLCLCSIAAAASSLSGRVWAFEHGEQLTTLRRTPQMVGTQVVDWLAPQAGVKFLKAKGSWLWVVGNRAGWIRSRDLVTRAEAQRMARAKLQRYPATARGLAERADTKMLLDDYAGALADIDRSLRLDPRQLKCHEQRGMLLLKLDRHEEAIREFTETIEQSSTDDIRLAVLYHMRAACRTIQGDKLGGKIDEQCAYDLDPLWPNVVEVLGLLTAIEPAGEAHAGERCLQLMRRACELTAWSDASTVHNLAKLYILAKDYDRALACARIAEAIVPTNRTYASYRRDLVRMFDERRKTVFDSAPAKAEPDAFWKRQTVFDDLPNESFHFQ